MSKFKILKEKVVKNEFKVTDLTSDCWYVTYTDGESLITDLVKSTSMGEVFDKYYDDKKYVKEIVLARGHLNPKIHQPKIK